jgi:nucleoid-associated protein YgaU
MIFKGSRYQFSTVDFFSTNTTKSEQPVIFYTFSKLGLLSYWEHQYVQGERLDQIASKYYQNPKSWWLIAEYNPQIVDFTNITPGTLLRIPNV